MAKSKNFVFTWNNYTEEDVKSISSWLDHAEGIAYSHEVGESGTPHLQGFIHFKNQVRKPSEILGTKGVYFAVMKGTLKHSKEYCSKQSQLIELGIIFYSNRVSLRTMGHSRTHEAP